MTTRQHEPSCAYYGMEFKTGSANKICSCPGTEAAPRRAASKKTAAAKTSVTNPVALASSAGARTSGFLKVGDGCWRGWVVGAEGKELEIEELADGRWRSVSDGTVARELEQLLKKIL